MDPNKTVQTAPKKAAPSYTLRIKFGKIGSLAYISHLDLMRTMTKLLVRAGLPLSYSEGFNPIPRMTFSPPMSLGITSVCELCDVRLNGEREDGNLEFFKKSLAEVFPPEIPLYDVYFPENDLSKIAFAAYNITFVSPSADEDAASRVRDFMGQSEINIMKKTKSGIKEVDIAPLIRSSSVLSSQGSVCITCTLGASSDSFLNPILLANPIFEQTGLSSGREDVEYYEIEKLAMYDSHMNHFR